MSWKNIRLKVERLKEKEWLTGKLEEQIKNTRLKKKGWLPGELEER